MDKVVYQLSVKLTEEQRDFLVEVCEKEKRPKSWMIREVIDQWLEGYSENKK